MADPAVLAETARMTRAVLDEIGDDGSEFTSSAATRHRLEGAAIALEHAAAVGGPEAAGAGSPRS